MKDEEMNPAISVAERLEELRKSYREVDACLQALELQGGADLDVLALKRQKLQIKDEIERLVDSSLPDIIA